MRRNVSVLASGTPERYDRRPKLKLRNSLSLIIILLDHVLYRGELTGTQPLGRETACCLTAFDELGN
jgi:hypothetical protein